MIIADSSCLIILEKLELPSILKTLFHEITIPEAVQREVYNIETPPYWIKVLKVKQPIATIILEQSLGSGESEAISLAIERKAKLLIVDDLAARNAAVKAHLNITGTVGILIEARKTGLITNLKDILVAMQKHDFRISQSVFEIAIKLSGEIL